MNIIKKFYAYLHLRYAVHMADDAHKQYHQRFYVIPGDDGDLTVTDRRNFRGLNRKHWIRASGEPSTKDVKRNSFYYTAYGDESDPMPGSLRKAKKLEYYQWWEDARFKARERKKADFRKWREKDRERRRKARKNRRDARKQ